MSESELTPEERWRRHNCGFRFDPPEGPPETWSDADFERLYDRVISQRAGMWECEECTTPCRSLRVARQHVERRHHEALVGSAVRRQEDA